MYRNPTFIDTITPYTPNHPTQHKHAAIRYLHTYHLHDEQYNREKNIVQNAPIVIPSRSNHGKIPNSKENQIRNSQIAIPKQKWATFTYISKETTYITKIVKRANINIAYRTNITIQDNLSPKIHNRDKFSATAVYKLTCPDCSKAYIGQT